MLFYKKKQFFAEALGIDDFTCSNGVSQGLKNTMVLSPKKIRGEEFAINQGSIDLFSSKECPTIKKDYSPYDIFNGDENALFYKAQLSST